MEAESVEKEFLPSEETYKRAAHVMFFARTDQKLWDEHSYKAFINMHLRFDGRLGFPGGLIDGNEKVETALNREVCEEMGDGNPLIVEKDWLCSHYSSKEKLLMHFYCKEVDQNEFFEIEKRGLCSKEYGVEILGLIRVPLYTRKRNNGGFPMFLKNNFAGTARKNLLDALVSKGIMNHKEIKEAQSCILNLLA